MFKFGDLRNKESTFKSDSDLLKKSVIFLVESLLKIMKNVFYFALKALVVLKIIKFLSRHFGHV